MAMPESDASDSQARHTLTEEPREQVIGSSGLSSEATIVDTNGSVSDKKSGLPADSTSFHGHVPDAQPSGSDEGTYASLPSSRCSPALIAPGEPLSPSSKQFTEEGGPLKSPSTRSTSARPDCGKSERGHIQHDEVCAAAQESNSSPKHAPVILADGTHSAECTVESMASSVVAEENSPGQDHAHRDCSSTGATPFGSDDFPEAGANPAACRSEASVSHQIDEQISRETLGSELSEHFTSAAAQSEDVIYMRAGPSEAPQTALHASDIGGRTLETSQPFPHSSSITRDKLNRDSLNNGNGALQPPGKTFTHNMFAGGPGSHPTFQTNVSSRGHVNRPVPASGGIQELLEVVEYKFKQNEQQLRQAYTNDSAQIQYELQQAYEENEELRSQVSALDERCNRSEGVIHKYRNQILKAKGLQKFLDSLGVDLHSLKRSYDQEKDNFARGIEASETEIKRLESTLRGKDQFEGMLSHSKTLLEKLLEARGFELQSLVQHRDLLRNQLDERIGQLVEERDNRMRLEQLVLELRSNERSSLTSSIEQCVASLVPKLADLGRQDDRLAISISSVETAIDRFAQRPMISSDDCDAIKAAVHDLGLRMTQTLSTESSNNLTVAEVCSSVDGIMQSHAKAIYRGLDRLETVSKQRADQGSTEAASQIELQHAKALLERVDSQLGTSMQREKSLSDEVAQAKARISELEGALSSATTSSLNEMSSAEVEKKVGEAVATTRKEMSDNAKLFIAQEKAKFANELKKVTNEHRKAAETAVAYQEKIDKLENELLEMQSLLSAANGRRGAHQQQEIDPDLDAKLAEGEVAKASIIDRDHKIAELTQIIEQCNIDLLHARSMSEQAREQVEEMRRQRESDIDDLCQKLSQAEEKSGAAEAGIAQTRSDAEQTIFTEQEKNRKHVESLQQSLDQAQSELQMRSEEADESQAFMKRNLIHQQEFWEKSNAELEAKASRFQIMLEEERQVLERTRNSQDDLRATISRLEAEKAKHQQQQVDYDVREGANQVIIKDLKSQLHASQIEITNLHAVQQRYLREKDERSSREAKARSTSDNLRKELNAAKAKIADLRAPKEHEDSSQVHDNVLGTGLTQDERMGHGSTHLVLDRSKTMRNEVLQPHAEDVEDGREPFLPPQQQRRLAVIVPNAELQHPGRPKQRRKADRSTNTVVNSGVESQYTQADVTPAQDQSHTIHEPDFMIYEDPQDSSNQDLDVESLAHTNTSTFHKPRPIPNIGSKRLTSTTSDKSSQGRGTQRTPENSFGQFSSQVYKTPDAPNYPFGSSPEFMNPSNTKIKRRYSGNSNGTPKDVHSPATQHPETFIPDPRIAARTDVSKRMPAKRGQQDGMLEPPTKRKHTTSTATQPINDRMSDNTFLGRSSQSVNSLPRIEDLNVGRTNQLLSSNMRSSAAPRRITRSQKSTKGDAYGPRFRQELQR